MFGFYPFSPFDLILIHINIPYLSCCSHIFYLDLVLCPFFSFKNDQFQTFCVGSGEGYIIEIWFVYFFMLIIEYFIFSYSTSPDVDSNHNYYNFESVGYELSIRHFYVDFELFFEYCLHSYSVLLASSLHFNICQNSWILMHFFLDVGSDIWQSKDD